MTPADNEAKIAPITGLVPMLPVLDVERSVAFYKLLGYNVGNRVPKDGPMGWAWLYAPNVPDWRRGSNLMLSCSESAVHPSRAGILFYLYATNLVSLREELLAAGQTPLCLGGMPAVVPAQQPAPAKTTDTKSQTVYITRTGKSITVTAADT